MKATSSSSSVASLSDGRQTRPFLLYAGGKKLFRLLCKRPMTETTACFETQSQQLHPCARLARNGRPKVFLPFSSFTKLFSASINEIILKPSENRSNTKTLLPNFVTFNRLIFYISCQTIINILIRWEVATHIHAHTPNLAFSHNSFKIKC